MAATFALNGGYAAAVTVLPLHATATWAATPAQLGIMFSVFSLLGFLGAPLGGWVADKFGRRAGVTPALLLAGSSAAACAAIGEHEAMLCAIVLWGLGNSLVSPGLNAFAADVAPPGARAQALSLQRQAVSNHLSCGSLSVRGVSLPP